MQPRRPCRLPLGNPTFRQSVLLELPRNSGLHRDSHHAGHCGCHYDDQCSHYNHHQRDCIHGDLRYYDIAHTIDHRW